MDGSFRVAAGGAAVECVVLDAAAAACHAPFEVESEGHCFEFVMCVCVGLSVLVCVLGWIEAIVECLLCV